MFTRRILFIIINSILFLSFITAQNKNELSTSAQVSILTCGPGEELYSIFGHTAIHIKDSINNIDYTYNYGVFDFNAPNFYWKFAQGRLNYMCSGSKYKYFMPEYYYTQRRVTEQYLNFSQAQKQTIYDALLLNDTPENRYYMYDFFYDNCSSRVGLLIQNNIQNKIEWPTDFEAKTFRDNINIYMAPYPWIKLSLNTFLGVPTDNKVTPFQYLFLPDNLMNSLGKATIADGSKTKLVQSTVEVLDFPAKEKNSLLLINPLLIIGLITIIVLGLTFVELKLKVVYSALDNSIYIFAGFIGVLISFLWFFTDHKVCGPNINILWAFPLHLIAPIIIKRVKLYHWLIVLFISLFIVLWLLGIQFIEIPVIIFSIVMLFRALVNIFREKLSL